MLICVSKSVSPQVSNEYWEPATRLFTRRYSPPYIQVDNVVRTPTVVGALDVPNWLLLLGHCAKLVCTTMSVTKQDNNLYSIFFIISIY